MGLWNLDNINARRDATIGKAAIFYAPLWDTETELDMDFLGFTEGEVSVAFNDEEQALTLPEYTGSLAHEKRIQGPGPIVTIPIFTGSPALRAVLSPTGTASGGTGRQIRPVEYTLAIFPEDLFLDVATGQTQLELSYDGTAWELAGQALTTEQARLLGQSLWIWRGHFTRPDMTYRFEEVGKSVDETTFVAMYYDLMPNGHRAHTIGDPTTQGIDVFNGLGS